MKIRKNKRAGIMVVLSILTLLISIGYAALSAQLSINGYASIKAKSWSVHFSNIKLNANNNVASVTTEPTLSNNNTTITWGVSMDTPGQMYEFNVDVVNEGSIDAMVGTATNDIVTSTLTEDQRKYLEYTIKYVNGADIEQYDKLAAGETKTITIKLLFKQDIAPEDLPSNEQNGIVLNYRANYVQADSNAVTKVTEIAKLEIGESVNYSTTLNGVTLDEWTVFYNDGDYTYIILDDYLPATAISDSLKSASHLASVGTYGIVSTTSRSDLINAIKTTSNWDSLLTGTLNGTIQVNETTSADVYAMGSPTLELWVNSWNEYYPEDTLYTKYENPVSGKSFDGWFIGNTENPTLSYVQLSNKSGYNNKLYFPRQTSVMSSCWGYWLASPSASVDSFVMEVTCEGSVYNSYYSYNDGYMALRPLIRLPSSVINQ